MKNRETWFEVDVFLFTRLRAFFEAKFDMLPRTAGAVNR